MYKSSHSVADKDAIGARKRIPRLPVYKRSHSIGSPPSQIPKTIDPAKKINRRCTSLSPVDFAKKATDYGDNQHTLAREHIDTNYSQEINANEKDNPLPQCLLTRLQRALATKRREFMKIRKSVIAQQKTVLEAYAGIRELEAKVGTGTPREDNVGEVRVVSLNSWPAHDLLMLLRDDLEFPITSELPSVFGSQVMQQLTQQLSPVPEEVLSMGAELMARRIELVNLIRTKYRLDRPSHSSNHEWRSKNIEFDQETERLHRLVAGTAENLKAKINYSLELAKLSWIDRNTLVKKIEKVQKDNMILQQKLDDLGTVPAPPTETSGTHNPDNVTEELAKERAAREALKEVVLAAESMLRVARSRITTLERSLKDTKAELETARRKHKDLEQLYRHRETSYDVRSKKLMEVSKTGEITIETLSRQRDALELRVKELREQAEVADKIAESREAEQRSRTESLQAKVSEQEKRREAAESRVAELEVKVKELEETILSLRERSGRLVDMERRRCLEYVPTKESEPTDRETELWKELQSARLALSRAEEELRLSRADKDSFLNSLSKIAQDEAGNLQEKMGKELLEKEQRISKLQQAIDEQRENEKLMEQSMTQYENQLAALRLEVKRLRNYDCYSKEVPHQELQTELLELHLQVEALHREKDALVSAAASRALMLERHERAADLFARVTQARRDLSALVEDNPESPSMKEMNNVEHTSRSLSSICGSAAETWAALRSERARVLRLESAVLAQSLQLERESRVRTQLERRRAMLEREVLRINSTAAHGGQHGGASRNNASLIQDVFCYR